jgi:hypothetical protein
MTTIMRVDEELRRPGPGRSRFVGVGLLVLVLAGAAVAIAQEVGGPTGSAEDAMTSGGDGGDAAASATTVADAAESATEAAAEAPAGESVGPVADLAGAPLAGPRIVKTGDLRVEVAAGGFGRAAEESARVAQANGGFVESSTSSSLEAGRAEGDITIRVPSANFDAARRSLAGLGQLRSEQVEGEDVTSQLVDLGARLRSLRAEEDVLNDLLGRAANIGEVLQVRDRIAGVRLQIEQLAAQEAALDGAANLATLRVSLFEPDAVASTVSTEDEGTLAARLSQAVDGTIAVVGGMILVVGWLVPFAVLGGLVWLALRLFPRHRPTTAPDPT